MAFKKHSADNGDHLDEAFFVELLKLPTFPFYRLIRQNAEQAKEQRAAWLNAGTPPTFLYPETKDFDALKYLEAVEKCRDSLPDGPAYIRSLYIKKLNELKMRAALVLAISHGDDQTVTHLSRKLFGNLRQDAEELKKEFSCMLDHANIFHTHTEPINAEMFTAMTHKVLDHYKIDDWKVALSDKSSIKITRGRRARKPVIYIPTNLKISKARAARLLTHEIEVHALRTQNGRRSPLHILHVGLNGYIRTDEGLAIYYQQKISKEKPQHAPGFWDAWTCALTQTGSFADTFAIISDARSQLAAATGAKDAKEVGIDAAWRLCVRAYRGITDTSTYGVGFLRGHIYRSGLLDITEAVDWHGEEILEKLFIGNIGLEHISIFENQELPEPQLPMLVSKSIVRDFS